MSTTTWYLTVGKQRIPVSILWTGKGRAIVKVGQNCDRGDAGENLYVSSNELQEEQKTHNENTQLTLF